MGDFITKPIDQGEFLARVARTIALAQRERSLHDALHDPMTGLANYRSLARNLAVELDRARRYNHALSLLTIDLDGLKRINDELGHGVGNDAIRIVASVLEGAVRKFETVARQGGDELSILLPNAGGAEALLLAERLRGEVARRSVRGCPPSDQHRRRLARAWRRYHHRPEPARRQRRGPLLLEARRA